MPQLTTKDIKELHIDRAYLVSHWVKQRTSDMTILCKAWKVRNDKSFEKHAFVLEQSLNSLSQRGQFTLY